MRGRLAIFIVAFALAYGLVSLLFGAEAPTSVPAHSLVRVKATADEVCFVLNKDLSPVDVEATVGGLVFTGPPGRYVVLVTNVATRAPQTLAVNIGSAPPVPPGPTPPTPPGPDPPDPDPVPPVPVPDPGLRVLVVYESKDLPKMSRDQLNILTGGDVHEFLSSACAKVNGTPEWRMVDQHDQIRKSSVTWERMFGRPRASVPWVVISNGEEGHEGPLPANSSEFIDLVRRFQQ